MAMPAGGAAPGAAAAADEPVAEQTEFDVKLTGFDAKAKIKVIKEVRAITQLGLKEVRFLGLLSGNMELTERFYFCRLRSLWRRPKRHLPR
jgi:hypothetical protein